MFLECSFTLWQSPRRQLPKSSSLKDLGIGCTALIAACVRGQCGIVTMLLQRGARAELAGICRTDVRRLA